MAPLKPPVSSLEAKLLHYHYVDTKLSKFQQMVSKLDPKMMPDLKPIILMAGSIFNISDHFFRRSELLQKGDRFNAGQLIHLTGNLTPLSWDSLEALDDMKSGIGSNWSSKRSFCELPNEKKSIEMIKLLQSLINNERIVLNEKIKMARELYFDQNKQLFDFIMVDKADQFDELDLIKGLNHSNIPTNLNIKQQEQIKSFFRHSYFNMLKNMCVFYQTKLDTLRLEHAKLTIQTPLTQFNFYQIYFSLLRIADMYVEIRKIGRWFYFDNATYFSQFARSNRKLKETIGEMSISFGSNKQNSLILSTISKYSKRTLTPINSQNLKHQMEQITSQFIIESRKAGKQMSETLINCISTLKNLCDEWDSILIEDKEHTFSQEKLREQMKQRVIDSRNRQSMLIDPSLAQKAANMKLAATNGAMSASKQPQLRFMKPPSRPQSRVSSRSNSLTGTNEITRKLMEIKDTELASTDEKRRMSLTSSSKSPFQKPPMRPPQSRSNSLTKKVPAHSDSSSDLTKLFQKPKLPDEDMITPDSSPLKSEQDDDPLKGLRRTSSARTSPTLQRRHSVISPLRPQVANGDTLRRRQSVYSTTGSISNTPASPPVLKPPVTTEVARPKPLTAQQRLQQHILKSQKNGSMLAKPLEVKRTPTVRQQHIKKSTVEHAVDTVDLGIELGEPKPLPQPVLQVLSGTTTNFPGGSPLNSLKKSSKQEAHAAVTAVQRSKPNSNVSHTPVRSRAGSSSNQLSRNSSVRSRSNSHLLRSRAGSSSSKSTLGGNTVVVESDDKGIIGEDGEIIKRVRFTGIAQYSEDEDAHTSDRMRKQMRQKWAAYKPLFRKLNSQEGETLRQFKEEERQHDRPLAASQINGSAIFEALNSTMNERGRVSMMNALNESSNQSNSAKRISKLFGRR